MFYRVAATCPSAPRRAGPTRGPSAVAALINRDDLENRYEKWKKMKNKVRSTYIYIALSRPNLGNIIYMEDDFFFNLVPILLYPGTRRTYTNRTKENQEESAASTTRYVLYNIFIVTLYRGSAGRRVMRWLFDSIPNNDMTTIGRKY